METKVAKKGSYISNSTYRERIIPGETALKEIYHISDRKTGRKIKEIIHLCLEVLDTVENHKSHYADAAIDLVIDKNHKVWLLELQLNYAAESKQKRSADEQEILPKILPTPFEYAKALTGL